MYVLAVRLKPLTNYMQWIRLAKKCHELPAMRNVFHDYLAVWGRECVSQPAYTLNCTTNCHKTVHFGVIW